MQASRFTLMWSLLTLAPAGASATVLSELSQTYSRNSPPKSIPFGSRGYFPFKDRLYFAKATGGFARTDGTVVEDVWAGAGAGFYCEGIAGATQDDLFLSCTTSPGTQALRMYEPQSPDNSYASGPTPPASVPAWPGTSYFYRLDATGAVTQHWVGATGYLAKPLYANASQLAFTYAYGSLDGLSPAVAYLGLLSPVAATAYPHSFAAPSLYSCARQAITFYYSSGSTYLLSEGALADGTQLLWQGTRTQSFGSSCLPMGRSDQWSLVRMVNGALSPVSGLSQSVPGVSYGRGVLYQGRYYFFGPVSSIVSGTAQAVRCFDGATLNTSEHFALAALNAGEASFSVTAQGLYLLNGPSVYRLGNGGPLAFEAVKTFPSGKVRPLGETASGLVFAHQYAVGGAQQTDLWVTQGTDASTQKLAAALELSDEKTSAHGKVFFGARAGAGEFEPWVSDGTAEGTFRVAVLESGEVLSRPALFARVGGKVLVEGCVIAPPSTSCTTKLYVFGHADDTTPPVITPVVSGTEGDDGWYRSDVAVTFNAADPEGLAFSNGCEPQSVTDDSAQTRTFTCTARSLGGVSTSTVTVKRDAAAPALTCPADVKGVGTGSATVTFDAPTASDAIDPAPSVTLSHASGSAFPVGTTLVTASARDAAGNVAECQFRVVVAPKLPGLSGSSPSGSGGSAEGEPPSSPNASGSAGAKTAGGCATSAGEGGPAALLAVLGLLVSRRRRQTP